MYDDLLRKTFNFINKMKPGEYEYLKRSIYFSEIAKGDMIFGTHDRCKSIPLVIKGSLRLFRTSDEGREMTSYYIMPGNACVLAAICTMGSFEYDFSAQAEEKTLMAMISPEGFRHLTDISIEFKNFIFNEMAEKLIFATSLIDNIKFTKVEERLLNYINEKADSKGELKITHERLAVNTGTVREVVSRQLKKLENNGKVSLKRGKIKLL